MREHTLKKKAHAGASRTRGIYTRTHTQLHATRPRDDCTCSNRQYGKTEGVNKINNNRKEDVQKQPSCLFPSKKISPKNGSIFHHIGTKQQRRTTTPFLRALHDTPHSLQRGCSFFPHAKSSQGMLHKINFQEAAALLAQSSAVSNPFTLF